MSKTSNQADTIEHLMRVRGTNKGKLGQNGMMELNPNEGEYVLNKAQNERNTHTTKSYIRHIMNVFASNVNEQEGSDDDDGNTKKGKSKKTNRKRERDDNKGMEDRIKSHKYFDRRYDQFTHLPSSAISTPIKNKINIKQKLSQIDDFDTVLYNAQKHRARKSLQRVYDTRKLKHHKGSASIQYGLHKESYKSFKSKKRESKFDVVAL